MNKISLIIQFNLFTPLSSQWMYNYTFDITNTLMDDYLAYAEFSADEHNIIYEFNNYLNEQWTQPTNTLVAKHSPYDDWQATKQIALDIGSDLGSQFEPEEIEELIQKWKQVKVVVHLDH